ncbi:hypothetical protein FGO68_gene1599 [Halteria grandinella]|uniref:Uncharacterized protein n=1 Tax=Halteria grandinella TaxID=5974 RepID=A0A8J8T717_HALGN|nr:hypothetical protein FGO68_gene1599 [Halteria grandinella]
MILRRKQNRLMRTQLGQIAHLEISMTLKLRDHRTQLKALSKPINKQQQMQRCKEGNLKNRKSRQKIHHISQIKPKTCQKKEF